jgi:hypothetical protein
MRALQSFTLLSSDVAVTDRTRHREQVRSAACLVLSNIHVTEKLALFKDGTRLWRFRDAAPARGAKWLREPALSCCWCEDASFTLRSRMVIGACIDVAVSFICIDGFHTTSKQQKSEPWQSTSTIASFHSPVELFARVTTLARRLLRGQGKPPKPSDLTSAGLEPATGIPSNYWLGSTALPVVRDHRAFIIIMLPIKP